MRTNEILAAIVGTPAPPKAEPQPILDAPCRLNAGEAAVALLLDEAGEPNTADAKKLQTLNAEWCAHLNDCVGYSQPDAIREHRRLCDAFAAKKTDVVPPHRSEVIRQFSFRRGVLKQSALKISEAAREIAATCYERSLKSFPKLRARIVAQESAIFKGELPASPLLRMIDDLPRTINARIEKLRIKGINSRPSDLLPKL